MSCFLILVLPLLIVGICQCQNAEEEVRNVDTRTVSDDFYGSEGQDRNRNIYPNDFGLPETTRQGFDRPPHHHHHRGSPSDFDHHHHFHRDYDSAQQTMVVEGGNATPNSTIPLDFAKALNDVIANDLLLTVIEDKPADLFQTQIASRFSEVSGIQAERSAGASMARPAKCVPELTTVKIAQSEDRNVFYVPECTRIERCGGCCSHMLLSCQPEETETVTLSVVKTEYTGNNKLKYVGFVPIVVEKHTKCKCQCKIKKADCSNYQEYKESECRCICKNSDEERKCYKNSYKKLWNPDQCTCQCRDIQPCSTGFEFDHNECRCIQSQLRRRYVLTSYTNKEDPE
ncbi:uncharacterized protein [Euwallacea fornicatus]|uniref:uncharacterized protein isoform X1 n=1 Tax=Euwallacea fornicatus TaxID=995702 RepID=UPI0033901BC7